MRIDIPDKLYNRATAVKVRRAPTDPMGGFIFTETYIEYLLSVALSAEEKRLG